MNIFSLYNIRTKLRGRCVYPCRQKDIVGEDDDMQKLMTFGFQSQCSGICPLFCCESLISSATTTAYSDYIDYHTQREQALFPRQGEQIETTWEVKRDYQTFPKIPSPRKDYPTRH